MRKLFKLCILALCISATLSQDEEVPAVSKEVVDPEADEQIPINETVDSKTVEQEEDAGADDDAIETDSEVVPLPDPPQASPTGPRNAGEPKVGRMMDSNWDPTTSRYAPDKETENAPYTLTIQRLKEIRERFMYPFFDLGGPDNTGDYQTNIQTSSPTIHKNLNYQLPFFGFRYNYTRVSLNGYLEFSDPPENYPTYPLIFPVKEWPEKNDPAFIGIFHSRCRIGSLTSEEQNQQHRPGVYFRLERDLRERQDRMGVEIRDRLMWDIRQGVIGADSFNPKHALITTWKNVSFAGGISQGIFSTNTFQLVLATDEVFTYAIFNYAQLKWTTHTEAGGDTTKGEGGIPAFVGFNAGNGTRSYEYKPYSQASILRDLTSRGYANGFPGRHIFRIDENILLGTCNKDIDDANLPLMLAPESGNMLGGTIVNITGPCFEPSDIVRCKFDVLADEVVGIVVDRNRAICVQPRMYAEGYVNLEIAIGNEKYKWKGKYFVEPPASATEKIFFEQGEIDQKNPASIRMTWAKNNLTDNDNAPVRISLWGYREINLRPEFVYIDSLVDSTANLGEFTITPSSYKDRNNWRYSDIKFGFIQINLTESVIPSKDEGTLETNRFELTPVIWSRPIPLAWYFKPQWQREHGNEWAKVLCNDWIRSDRFLKNFAHELPQCPCTLQHALNDKGRYLPDFNCDKDTNPRCIFNKGATHCVRSGSPTLQGSEQQCCYDKNNMLMLTYDQVYGSTPFRAHNLGYLPWYEANKAPTMSQWFHDIVPKYLCCMWQDNQNQGTTGDEAVGCETVRFERRPTQDCVAYQPPEVAGVFGDPHIVTFDNYEYTFNGLGEYTLVQTRNKNLRLDVQGRFEKLPMNAYGEVRATQLTAVAARGNTSTIIEVRTRPSEARWRYHLDVLADGKRVYFDRPALKFQHFPGVLVYTPTYILNQSEVIMMFDSGAGVEVVENKGYLTARVYLPWQFINQTRGLFGNWSFDLQDDLTLPDGTKYPVSTNYNDFESLYREFGQKWMVEDKNNDDVGKALFYRESGRTSSYYNNKTFVPVYTTDIELIIPVNRSFDRQRTEELCHDIYQCRYDYAMSLNQDLAHFSTNYLSSIKNVKEQNKDVTISCGVLETPRFGRKSNFFFTPGTRVNFECNKNFILIGDSRRECMQNGFWNIPEYGYTECLREQEYASRTAGFTTAIILTVMVLLVVVLAFIAYKFLERRKKEMEQEESDERIRTDERDAFNTIRQSPPDDFYDDDNSNSLPSTLKKPEPSLSPPRMSPIETEIN